METRKTILVTGGGGAVGKRLLPFLMKYADIVSLDLRPVEGVTRSIEGSVTDADTALAAAEGVDAVLHMAYAHPTYESLASQVEVNITGAVNVLEACVARRIPRLVFASTVMTVWGGPVELERPACHYFLPVNFYSYTKCCTELLAEMYTRQHDFLSALCLRIGAPTETPGNPTRRGPKFGMARDGRVLLPYDDLCEAFRLALLEAREVKYATLFLTGDYGGDHYDVRATRETLGMKFQWQIVPDPEEEGAYLIQRAEGR